MIQRIQSIFLALAAACGFGALAAPFAATPQAVQASALFSDGRYAATDNTGLLVLFAVAGALAVAGIFLYKNRPVQLKISRFAVVANALGLVLAVVLFWQDGKNIGSAEVSDGVGAYLPFLFLVFGILSLRYIRKDEALVRSVDRLR